LVIFALPGKLTDVEVRRQLARRARKSFYRTGKHCEISVKITDQKNIIDKAANCLYKYQI
jgi:hypothetical protein